MRLPPNGFKAALAAGRTQLGVWSVLDGLIAPELTAASGFDWMLLDAEHSPLDLRVLVGQLQAVEPYATHAVVRPPGDDPVTIKQVLDAGARSLLVPMIDSAEQARRLVAATRYAPQGTRGLSTQTRAARWGRVEDYLRRAQDELCVLVQIESVTGAGNAAAISAVDGVDGVFIGPADLAASMGHLGDAAHPEVVDRVLGVAAVVRGQGKPVGILTADVELARRYLAAGFTFVAVGIDTALLARSLTSLRETFDA